MSDILDAYALLQQACVILDAAGDHAIAAYVGMGMALLEEKYGLRPDDLTDTGDSDGEAHPTAGSEFSDAS